MDNLTHSLLGALIGQAGLKKKTGLAMPALIIGANLPDVDAACFFWLDGVEHLAFRRGITHGPPALVLLPLILAGLLWSWDRWQTWRAKRPEGRLPVHFGWLYGLAFLGCLTHPLLDWLNVYGIRFFEPFSSQWYYGDVLFIIDVWLWLLMGAGLWWSLRCEKRGGDWRKVARGVLAVMLAYIGLNSFLTWRAENAAMASRSDATVAIASPPPLLSLMRQQIVGDGAGRYFTLGQQVGNVPLSTCDLDAARATSSQVDAFLFWSRTPVLTRLEDGSYELGDARYYGVRDGTFATRVPAEYCGEPGAD